MSFVSTTQSLVQLFWWEFHLWILSLKFPLTPCSAPIGQLHFFPISSTANITSRWEHGHRPPLVNTAFPVCPIRSKDGEHASLQNLLFFHLGTVWCDLSSDREKPKLFMANLRIRKLCWPLTFLNTILS